MTHIQPGHTYKKYIKLFHHIIYIFDLQNNNMQNALYNYIIK